MSTILKKLSVHETRATGLVHRQIRGLEDTYPKRTTEGDESALIAKSANQRPLFEALHPVEASGPPQKKDDFVQFSFYRFTVDISIVAL